jgi:hypothetical protein
MTIAISGGGQNVGGLDEDVRVLRVAGGRVLPVGNVPTVVVAEAEDLARPYRRQQPHVGKPGQFLRRCRGAFHGGSGGRERRRVADDLQHAGGGQAHQAITVGRGYDGRGLLAAVTEGVGDEPHQNDFRPGRATRVRASR